MANFIQMRFACECGKTDSKLIASVDKFDKSQYPQCCKAHMKPLNTHSGSTTHYVMGDITPYRSVVDGEVISSRSQHRNHLIKHNVIEAGNEDMFKHIKRPGYQKGDLRGQLKHNIEQHKYGR